MVNRLPDVIPKQILVEAIHAFNAGRTHHFADSTGYDLLHEGRLYPPKAIVGIAASEMLGVEFTPADFSGGLKSKCFRLLEAQGFTIQKKSVETVRLAEELPEDRHFSEGARTTITVNRYERDAQARRRAIEHHGYRCQVCNIDMEEVYGEPGKGFIHMHHLTPLHTVAEHYQLNPLTDLVPVCPNCHSMIHRKDPPFTVDELKQQLRKS